MSFRRYDIELAGKVVTGEFEYEETARRFGKYCLGESDCPEGIRVPSYEFEIWKSLGNESGPQYEFSCFTAAASGALSSYDRFIVHSAAFRWKDKAYLISAPSGGGKSTLLRTLKERYPDEISVICGDRPVLWKKEDGTVWVCPSPWNGKENWYGADAAPLGGTVILKRGVRNGISRLQKKEAAVSVFCSMIMTKETPEEIHRFAAFATKMIDAAPVWRLDSHEARDSAVLLYHAMNDSEVNDEV